MGKIAHPVYHKILIVTGLDCTLFTTAVSNHAAKSCIELSRSGELINTKVHTVTPVVTWVRRNVDTLIVRIAATKGTIH